MGLFSELSTVKQKSEYRVTYNPKLKHETERYRVEKELTELLKQRGLSYAWYTVEDNKLYICFTKTPQPKFVTHSKECFHLTDYPEITRQFTANANTVTFKVEEDDEFDGLILSRYLVTRREIDPVTRVSEFLSDRTKAAFKNLSEEQRYNIGREVALSKNRHIVKEMVQKYDLSYQQVSRLRAAYQNSLNK